MRLLSKSSLYFVVTSLVVFLLSGIGIYFLLQAIIHEEVDEALADQKSVMLQELREVNGFEHFILPKDSCLTIGPEILGNSAVQTEFSDTMIYSILDDELLPFRQIKFPATHNNQTRIITIKWSLIESDDLVEAITFSLFLVLVITIVSIIGLNFLSMRKLWQPFRNILEQIKMFDFRKMQGFEPVVTDITEFKELTNELVKMTAKLTHDYYSLKEFSENASHEMQTPLAIIQSKLELLFQQRDFDEKNLKALNAAYKATNRLSRLHHELNLLTRIENQEFKERAAVQLKTLLEDQIENFSDIIEMKNLQLETNLTTNPFIQGNQYLLEIMLSNLLNNAIKHNITDGLIRIELTGDRLTISNNGPEPVYPPEALFERFRKGKPGSDSTGLGLSLVKQICLYHGFKIRYSFQNKRHTIEINF